VIKSNVVTVENVNGAGLSVSLQSGAGVKMHPNSIPSSDNVGYTVMTVMVTDQASASASFVKDSPSDANPSPHMQACMADVSKDSEYSVGACVEINGVIRIDATELGSQLSICEVEVLIAADTGDINIGGKLFDNIASTANLEMSTTVRGSAALTVDGDTTTCATTGTRRFLSII
jgi:hypothetical protein